MKRILLAILVVMLFAGCTTRTEYGDCVGINNEDRDPALRYKINTWNVILGVVFVETIVVPIVVVLDDIYCPVGKKEVK